VSHGARPATALPRPRDTQNLDASLPVEDRDRIYQAAIKALSLRATAADELHRRGLGAGDIERFGFRSLTRLGREHADFMAAMVERFSADLLGACPGFVDKNGVPTFWAARGARDGYVVPFRDEAGRITGLQGKILGAKYLTATGARYEDMCCVAGARTETLFVIEGGLKAMVASVLGPAWCFGVPGQALQETHIATIRRLAPERVAVALDREINVNTDRMRGAWLGRLAAAGLVVVDAVWEGA